MSGSHLTSDQLRDWLNFSSPPESRLGIESHLEQCQQCASLLESLGPDDLPCMKRLQNLATFRSATQTLVDERVVVPKREERVLPGSTGTDRWRLKSLLRLGGIGEIWLARDQLLGRDVAVKRLRPKTCHLDMVQQRFIYEARVTAQLNHPSIVHILDLVEDGPRSYYAMSLVLGKTLTELIHELHYSIHAGHDRGDRFELVRVWVSVAQAIAFAHSQHVLHRDIKSDNVIVGIYGQVTVVDWGLAKRYGEPNLASLRGESVFGQAEQETGVDVTRRTRDGVRLGTPAFMAPEQARGDVDAIDQRTDTYALAAMLFEILTCRTPYVAEDAESMMESVRSGKLIGPKELNPAVPDELNRICLKGLSKDKRRRFQSAREFASAVENWLNETTAQRQIDLARQKLFELSSDLMVVFNRTPAIEWANSTWSKLLGWAADELVGTNPGHLVHPDDKGDNQSVLDLLKRGQSVNGKELRVRAQDGSYRWFSWSATPLLDEGTMVAIGRDIDVLVRRRNEFQNLLEATPEAIVVVNLDRTIHRVNQKACQLFGWAESDLIGQLIDVLIPKRYHRPLAHFFATFRQNPLAKPLLIRDKLMGRRQDGTQFKLGIRLSPVATDNSIRIVSTIRASEVTDVEARAPESDPE